MRDRKSDYRTWVAAWKLAGPELERIRIEELIAMTPERRRFASLAVLDLAVSVANNRTTSGFEEQQRLFQKARQ